jgi:uncharacterized protein (TIGR00251 family)
MKIIAKDGALLLAVKVVPNSSRTAAAGWLGDALKLKVAQPPEAGKANAAVQEFMAALLEIPKSRVAIVSGLTQPRKIVRILGMTREQVIEKLTPTSA